MKRCGVRPASRRIWVMLAGAFFAALALGGHAFGDQGAYPKTEEEKQAAFEALNWRDQANSYPLDRSHAQIKLPTGKILLLGDEARRFSWLVSGTEFPDTEAALSYDSEDASVVYFEWRDEGYVSDSDWQDVNADELLAQFSEATEQANAERSENGFAPMHVVGWLQRPTYDGETRTVSYAVELKDDTDHWANAVALRLGRGGYTEMTWVGSIATLQRGGNRPDLLQAALNAHAYDEGYRYADFQEGDKVAAFGIGGLLATALGLKMGKGLIAAAIAFLLGAKKIVIPAAVVGGAAIFAAIRKFLGRRSES